MGGAEDGETGLRREITLGDSFPIDSQSFGQFRLTGDKIGCRPNQHQTVRMFAEAAGQHPRVYASLYGEEHLYARLGDVDRLNEIRGERPHFFTARCIGATWGRMVFHCDACVAECCRMGAFRPA